MRQFRKKLREAEKVAKHMWQHVPMSAKKEMDSAYQFRVETQHEVNRHRRTGRAIYMKKKLGGKHGNNTKKTVG